MPFLGHGYALLVILVFWGGLIALAIWAVRRFRRPSGTSGNALNILNDRFARGEIDQQEYEKRKAALLRR
jgi:putative membrane protein